LRFGREIIPRIAIEEINVSSGLAKLAINAPESLTKLIFAWSEIAIPKTINMSYFPIIVIVVENTGAKSKIRIK
jgi:hypothetical protein